MIALHTIHINKLGNLPPNIKQEERGLSYNKENFFQFPKNKVILNVILKMYIMYHLSCDFLHQCGQFVMLQQLELK